MKKYLFFIGCLLALVGCNEPTPIVPEIKNDLSNIKDSAYFLLKWQGKEIFLRENPSKKVEVMNHNVGRIGDSIYFYTSRFGKEQIGLPSMDTQVLELRLQGYMQKQSLSNFKKLVEVGKKMPHKGTLDDGHFIAFTDDSKNLSLWGYLQGNGEDYFEVLESRSLLEERGEPSEILVKFRFKYKMYSPKNVELGYLEGEAQTRVRYVYFSK